MSVDVIERMREAAHGAYIHLTRADVERMARVLLEDMAPKCPIPAWVPIYARSIGIDLTATASPDQEVPRYDFDPIESRSVHVKVRPGGKAQIIDDASDGQEAADGKLRHSPGDTQP